MALVEGRRLASQSCHFTPRTQLNKRLGGTQSRSGRYEEVDILDPTGTRTPPPQSSSQSLFRLRYHCLLKYSNDNINIVLILRSFTYNNFHVAIELGETDFLNDVATETEYIQGHLSELNFPTSNQPQLFSGWGGLVFAQKFANTGYFSCLSFRLRIHDGELFLNTRNYYITRFISMFNNSF
jgi:hypothetical protein